MRTLTTTLFTLIIALASASFAHSNERGAALYEELCANCHGALAVTDKPNRPYGRLASAIRVVPSMFNLKRLNSTELEAIVTATTQPDRPYRTYR